MPPCTFQHLKLITFESVPDPGPNRLMVSVPTPPSIRPTMLEPPYRLSVVVAALHADRASAVADDRAVVGENVVAFAGSGSRRRRRG